VLKFGAPFFSPRAFFFPFSPPQRGGAGYLPLLGTPQEVAEEMRQRAFALWKPAVRKGRVAVALLIFSQKLASSKFSLVF
jgi:hypothetical protein